MGKEFEIRRVTDPAEGPLDGVECTIEAVRTTFAGMGRFKSIRRQDKTQVSVKASCQLGIISISDQEKNQMLTLSISELAVILNEALRAAR